MPNSPDISVQLYTVRAALAADPDATLGRLTALGFRLVEPFGLLEHAGVLREGLPGHGLSAPTAHADILGRDGDAALEAAAELGIATVIQPWTDPARWRTRDGLDDLAGGLADAAARARPLGLRVGYHNHEFELATRIDGRHALEMFADRLSPDVVLEVDTWWAHVGGADVPALLERLGDRVVALHLKDGDGSGGGKLQVPLGRGSLPLRPILAAAPMAMRVIELDETAGDVFEAIRIGRELLVGLADEGPAAGA